MTFEEYTKTCIYCKVKPVGYTIKREYVYKNLCDISPSTRCLEHNCMFFKLLNLIKE